MSDICISFLHLTVGFSSYIFFSLSGKIPTFWMQLKHSGQDVTTFLFTSASYSQWLEAVVRLSHRSEQNISRTPEENHFKFGTNVHLDSQINR